MATETEIINSALRRSGAASRIMDTSESIASAGVASDILRQERDELLREGVWNFTVTRVQLVQLSIRPVFGWSFAYCLPLDLERVVSVHDNARGAGGVPYKLENLVQADGSDRTVLVSGSNSIFLRYCRKMTDPNLCSASFNQVLILRLAKIFAMSVSRSNALFTALEAEEDRAMKLARSIDGIEDYPEAVPEGTWANSRRLGGWAINADGSGGLGGFTPTPPVIVVPPVVVVPPVIIPPPPSGYRPTFELLGF